MGLQDVTKAQVKKKLQYTARQQVFTCDAAILFAPTSLENEVSLTLWFQKCLSPVQEPQGLSCMQCRCLHMGL